MSEYQYYEFQAIDRPLSDRQMRELRAISSRAQITQRSFTNFYTFGDFKGRPSILMEKYFDAFLYLANWGTHELMLRVPKRLLASKTASSYCMGDSASARAKGDHVILAFRSEEEGGDWEEDGEGLLSSMLPLRSEIGRGDLRVLYLGWLLCVQQDELDEEQMEPEPPPGLRKLSQPLRAFADFLRIDSGLLEAAAQASPDDGVASPPSPRELAAWIKTLPESEKDKLLLRAAKDGGESLQAELLTRLQHARIGPEKKPTGRQRRRTVAELLSAAEELRARRTQRRGRAGRKSTGSS